MTDLATIVDRLTNEGAEPVVHTVLDTDVGDAIITTPGSPKNLLYVAGEDTTYRFDTDVCSCGNGCGAFPRDVTLSNQAYSRKLREESCAHQVASLNSPWEGQGQCECGATTVIAEPLHDRSVHVMTRYRCTQCDDPRFMA